MTALYPFDILALLSVAIARCESRRTIARRKLCQYPPLARRQPGAAAYRRLRDADERAFLAWSTAVARLEMLDFDIRHPGFCVDCGETGSHHSDCWTLADHTPVTVPSMEAVARTLLG